MFALVAVTLSPALVSNFARTQNPKPQVTILEGVWRETPLPGEKPADKFCITVASDKIVIKTGKGTYSGTLTSATLATAGESTLVSIRITLKAADGEEAEAGSVYVGRCWNEDGRLYLLFNLDRTSFSRNGPVAVARSLEKVKE